MVCAVMNFMGLAHRQAHGEIAAVVEDVEESEAGDSPDEDSDVEPVCPPPPAHVPICEECRSTFRCHMCRNIAHFLVQSKEFKNLC